MDMDACAPFFTYCRFPTIVIAAGRLIVVTQKQAGFIGQAQQPADGTVKNASVATGEIRPRRAIIRHEQCIADKGRVADQISDVRTCMPRNMHDGEAQHAH